MALLSNNLTVELTNKCKNKKLHLKCFEFKGQLKKLVISAEACPKINNFQPI